MKDKKTTTVGLVIGKFTQLHKGHVDLLKFALKTVDKVFVVVYHTPDRTSIPLDERAGWIRALVPDERLVVIEGWDAPNRHEDTPEVRRLQEDYLGRVMDGIGLTHIISSEDYADHLSKYLGVKNVMYDKERARRPISSTMIRENVEKYLDQIPELIRHRVLQDNFVDSGSNDE